MSSNPKETTEEKIERRRHEAKTQKAYTVLNNMMVAERNARHALDKAQNELHKASIEYTEKLEDYNRTVGERHSFESDIYDFWGQEELEKLRKRAQPL